MACHSHGDAKEKGDVTMVPFNHFLGLAGVGALIAFTAGGTPTHAGESSQSVGSAPPQASLLTDCHTLRRAISRRACVARLSREEQVDVAEKRISEPQAQAGLEH
jgi:hypothetical protein